MSSDNKSFEFHKPASSSTTAKARASRQSIDAPASVKKENEEKDEVMTSSDPTKLEQGKDTKDSEVESVKYDSAELMAIFDELLFSGEYTEDVLIKGKLPVRFRTRTSEEVDKMTREIDSLGANLYSTVEQKRSLLNMQYALMQYQGKDLSTAKLAEKAEFISKLPAMIVFLMVNALAKFDDKVFQASKEGEENF